MAKAAAAPSKAPASAKRTAAKTKPPATKKTPIKKSSAASGVIGSKRKGGKTAKKKAPPPLPKGWPASSKLSYSAPREAKAVENDGDIMDLDSDADDSAQPGGAPANYLRPGNLLQQFCNGSDVFLRKRAVQSTSMVFPTITKGENGTVVANKGAPARFLIVFPGRLSLKVPPAAKKDDAAGDEDGDTDSKMVETKSDTGDGTSGAESAKKRKAFQPANPPQLLGKLVSVGGDERKMELRIPMPSSDSNETDSKEAKQLVMSGRAIPLSGKYMALTFKRTGGSKDSSAASTPKNKKRGTGSIMCKDIFRSAIVLGDSKVLDSAGKALALGDATKTSDPDNTAEKDVGMKHYGGSERTLDGGGKAGVVSGRKSLTSAPSATAKRKNSVPSEKIELESDDSDGDDVEDTNVSSDAGSDGEFVPAAAKKKKGRASAGAKRKARSDSDSDEEEEVTPSRKRTPRRSAAKAAKVNYADENSDVDIDGSGSDENESGNESSQGSDSEEDFTPKAKPKARKPAAKAPKAKPVAKADKGSTAKPKKKGASIKDMDVDISDSDDDEDTKESLILSDSEEEEEYTPKAKSKAQAKAATKTKAKPPAKAAAKAATKATRASKGSATSAKKAPVSTKKASEVIEIDDDELDPDEVAKSAKKRLEAMLSSPTKSTSKSPKKSPIARGRRKKNSPPPQKTTPLVSLDFDDDAGFL